MRSVLQCLCMRVGSHACPACAVSGSCACSSQTPHRMRSSCSHSLCACLVSLIPFCVLRRHPLSESLSLRKNSPEPVAWCLRVHMTLCLACKCVRICLTEVWEGIRFHPYACQIGSRASQQCNGRLPHLCVERRHGIFERIRTAATPCALSQNRE